MGHSFTSFHSHLVWSTKERAPIIDERIQDRLYGYIGGIIREKGGELLACGGVSDHIHLLLRMPSIIANADFLRHIKANSSKFINKNFPCQRFSWQEGYAGFAVSVLQLPRVKLYIKKQEEHHKKLSFQEEFVLLLKKHKIEFDAKYLF
ncbi:IS200/IS605 family transposase [Candidatus Babeliales bacterium]|nr:IS200/IS605 family transposase [Candidatus Babeliales bacterium]